MLNLQIYGDPEAADIVFTSGANIAVVGINITTQCKFTGEISTFLLASISRAASLVLFCFNFHLVFKSLFYWFQILTSMIWGNPKESMLKFSVTCANSTEIGT